MEKNYRVLNGNVLCNFPKIESAFWYCWEKKLQLSSSNTEFYKLEEWVELIHTFGRETVWLILWFWLVCSFERNVIFHFGLKNNVNLEVLAKFML